MYAGIKIVFIVGSFVYVMFKYCILVVVMMSLLFSVVTSSHRRTHVRRYSHGSRKLPKVNPSSYESAV